MAPDKIVIKLLKDFQETVIIFFNVNEAQLLTQVTVINFHLTNEG